MKIEIQDLTRDDIASIITYWHDSPPVLFEAMGVDPAKIAPRDQMRANLEAKCAELESGTTESNVLIILADGQPIGMHTLFPVTPGESGVFHAHIWKPEMRGKGVAVESYPLACKRFVERFNLKEILFKTPIVDRGPNRVKEKLGLRSSGVEPADAPILRPGIQVQIYRWSRADILAYRK